jgi:hypothetical protein
MNTEEFASILAKLEPGMSGSVPLAWAARILPGPDMDRDIRVTILAATHSCGWSKVGTTLVFTRHATLPDA